MDLIDQTVSGTNEIYLTDSLNTSLPKLNVKTTADTVVPSSNDVIIYVDKSSSSTPTEERKQYVLNLTKPLKFYNQVSDELVEEIQIKGNEVKLEAFVNRMVGTNENGNYVLESEVKEELDSIPITLFEGINYIYTNYTNASITLIYPKDNELNRAFLNNTIYSEHLKNDQEVFSLDDLYFKDAFTKTGNKLNLEVDNASIDCLTSKNNKFSLDSEGNLTVNSITTAQQLNFDKQEIGNYIYPVGSIYFSINSTNPASLFGGTWVSWGSGKVPVGVDTLQTEFKTVQQTGGTKTHTLTQEQMPKHMHGATIAKTFGYGGDGHFGQDSAFASGQNSGISNWSRTNRSSDIAIEVAGGGQAHNNLQPYITCYMWKRTA